MMHKFTFQKISATAAIASLVACGGGGNGSPTASQIPAIVQPTSPMIASVAAPTYSGETLSAFNTLNAERERCGFGLLAQNANLDIASNGHVDWLLLNNHYGHYQVADTPGFTGVFPEDRIVAAGYSPNAAFSFTETNTYSYGATAAQGAFLTRKLLNAPFHEIVMLRGFLDVGVSFKQLAGTPDGRFVLNLDYGSTSSAGLQTPAAGSVRTYPCEGSTGIQTAMYGEEPSPVPGRDFVTNPLGATVAVVGDVGKTLAISAVSMAGPGGAPVALRPAVTASTDTTGILKGNEALISADVALAPNTTFQVSINGTSGAVTFSRTFSFRTSSN